MAIYLLKFMLLIYCFKYFSKKRKYSSTIMVAILNFIGFQFIIYNNVLLPVIFMIGLVPIIQRTMYSVKVSVLLLSSSSALLPLILISYFISNRFLTLRYKNQKVPWSFCQHSLTYFEFIYTLLLIVFSIQSNPDKYQLVLY